MDVKSIYSTIDTHVAGEAFRIIIFSPLLIKEDFISSDYDRLKQILLNEPRGHRQITGCIVLPSSTADYKLIFLSHKNEAGFKYGGLVASITALLETGNIKKKNNGLYSIETMSGIYKVKVMIRQNRAVGVEIKGDNCEMEELKNDVYKVLINNDREYFVYPKENNFPSLTLDNLSVINRWGRETAKRLMDQEYKFTGFILLEEIADKDFEFITITFRRDGTILRSPGFDTSFVIAAKYLSNEEGLKNKYLYNKSIFGSEFKVELDNTINTRSYITGIHQFVLDEDDPLNKGFILK